MFVSCSHLKPLFAPLLFVGYGNIAPSTEGGKIFCILYAIFGIPLFGFLLAGVGDQLGTIFVKSIAKVEKMFRVSHNITHFVCLVCYYLFIWSTKEIDSIIIIIIVVVQMILIITKLMMIYGKL